MNSFFSITLRQDAILQFFVEPFELKLRLHIGVCWWRQNDNIFMETKDMMQTNDTYLFHPH